MLARFAWLMVRSAKQNFTGTKRMASERKKSSSSGPSVAGKRVSSPNTAATRRHQRSAAAHFVICIRNEGYRASLDLRKLYPVLPDQFAEEHNMIRVVDESGEDYLYPANYFVRLDLPQSVEQTLHKIA